MKKILTCALLGTIVMSTAAADFMYEEIDPICSISGTTHTSFPGEISDTSSWSMPKAYDGECDVTPKLSESDKEVIYSRVLEYFQEKDAIGPVYGDEALENSYGNDTSLNPEGQKVVNDFLFPNILARINAERAKENPNEKRIALLNNIAKTIGYDYFLLQVQ